MSDERILNIKDLDITFSTTAGTVHAIRGINIDLYKGETVAIVGESGSGKSVTMKAAMGILASNAKVEKGTIEFSYHHADGTPETVDILTKDKKWIRRHINGKRIAMVFQDPMTSLNPVRTIGEQITEVITWHFGTEHEQAKREAIELLKRVGIADAEYRYKQYPNEFSGGMRQRVVIATAIACRPEILICDEPTTALDVTVQAQIIRLIKELQKELDMTVVYITHDLGVVASVADWVGVMYVGQIIEYGTVHEIFKQPAHPYTKALLMSLPQLGVKGNDLYSIKGAPPNLFKKIEGDAFAPRNPEAMEIDFEQEPPRFDITPTHWAKTWLLHPYAEIYRKELDSAEHKRKISVTKPEKPFGYKNAEKLLQVKNLSVNFKLGGKEFKAVDSVSFDIYKGETLSLVGESGSGKTTIGRAIMRIYNSNVSGSITYKGENIVEKMSKNETKKLHMEMQMIFQDPMASLNERAKVDYIISEGLYNYHLFDSEADRMHKVEEIMQEVGLPKEFSSRFPHEFSGGQRQRIGIARSLVMNPEFVVADEPISALDVSIRAQVINLLNKLKRERGLTYLFIAHDLSVVRFISDRIAVINKGRIVELAECEELFANPLHPYTKALLSAVPYPDPDVERSKKLLTYDRAMHNYTKDKPLWTEIKEGHFVLANQAEISIYRTEMEK